MKHFFHCKLNDNRGLLHNLFIDYLKQDVSEQLKVLYDAADIIHDKRLPDADEELKAFLQAGSDGNTEFPEKIWLYPHNHTLLKQLKWTDTSPDSGVDVSEHEKELPESVKFSNATFAKPL